MEQTVFNQAVDSPEEYMIGLEIELALAFFFLAALVLISRFRDQFLEEERHGYQQISASVSILSLIALLKLAAANSAFSNVLFLSDPGAIQLLVLVGSATGIVLLMSGISVWLPAARVHREIGRQRIERLEVVRKVLQLSRVESRIVKLLQGGLKYAAEGCRFERAELYCCPPYEKSVQFISGYSATDSQATGQGMVRFSPTLFSERNRHQAFDYSELIDNYPPGQNKVSLVQPILVKGRVVALMLFWTGKQEQVGTETRSIVNAVANLLSQQVHGRFLELRNELLADSNEVVRKLFAIKTGDNETRSFVTQLVQYFKTYLRFDQMSLTRLNCSGEVRRYSVGLNGAILEELNLDEKEVFTSRETLISSGGVASTGPGSHAEPGRGESLFNMPRMNSQLVGLIGGENGEAAIVRFGSAKSNLYRPCQKQILRTALPVLNEKLRQLSRHEDTVGYTDQIKSIARLIGYFATESEFGPFASRAAESLLAVTGSDMVRVSLADKRRTFLSSSAMRLSRSVEPQTPSRGHMILAVMPHHLRVLSGEPGAGYHQIDYSQPEEAAEWSQVLAPSICRAMIYPFGTAGTQSGTITIGSVDTQKKFNESDNFVQITAHLLSLKLMGSKLPTSGTMTVTEGRGISVVEGSSTSKAKKVRMAMTGLMDSIAILESDAEFESGTKDHLQSMRNEVNQLISLTSDAAAGTDRFDLGSGQQRISTKLMESI
ncbi:MAG: hypothetical protein P1R58_04945 [bacterium]|nr:hypothetical protein [bacterium]